MKLSFCIPTFNRGSFIGAALESILSQSNENIEIIVVDGASTDNTQEVLQEFKKQLSLVHVYRQKHNSGIDIDLLSAIKHAKGEYCWLMSDDDELEGGSIDHILDKLEHFNDIAGASVNYSSYDTEMEFRIATVPALIGMHQNTEHLILNRDECFSSLGMHLGYLSAQIVNRNAWNLVASKYDLKPYMNSSWLMVYIIGQMLSINPRWLYIHKECVKNRSANDSFVLRVGEYNRQLITHDSFPRVLGDLFGVKSEVFRTVTNATIINRMPRNLAKIKANNASIRLQISLVALYTKRYWKYLKYWIFVFPIFFVPNFILGMVRFFYLKFKKKYGRVNCQSHLLVK